MKRALNLFADVQWNSVLPCGTSVPVHSSLPKTLFLLGFSPGKLSLSLPFCSCLRASLRSHHFHKTTHKCFSVVRLRFRPQGMKGFLSALLSKPVTSLGQLEHDIETVIKVLRPGPLGMAKHKFSEAEIRHADTAVCLSVENWNRKFELEIRDGFMRPKE